MIFIPIQNWANSSGIAGDVGLHEKPKEIRNFSFKTGKVKEITLPKDFLDVLP
jgi:hypothetical protein